MNETTQRISTVTAVGMVIVALLFDIAQLAAKLLTLMGLTLAGGIIGALTCYYMNIDMPKSCTIAGGVIAFAASFTGIGTAIALNIGMLMDWLASTLFNLVGRALLTFWFWWNDVPMLTGNGAAKKAAVSITTFLVDSVPFINVLPGITIWTITTIVMTWNEDKKKDRDAGDTYNGEKDFRRVGRRVSRRYVPV